jgi:hypothetical protein
MQLGNVIEINGEYKVLTHIDGNQYTFIPVKELYKDWVKLKDKSGFKSAHPNKQNSEITVELFKYGDGWLVESQDEPGRGYIAQTIHSAFAGFIKRFE